MLIHDTPPFLESALEEFRAAVRHAAPRQALITGSNGDQTEALRIVAAELGAEYHFIYEEPDHVYRGEGVEIVVHERGAAGHP